MGGWEGEGEILDVAWFLATGINVATCVKKVSLRKMLYLKIALFISSVFVNYKYVRVCYIWRSTSPEQDKEQRRTLHRQSKADPGRSTCELSQIKNVNILFLFCQRKIRNMC